MSKFRVFTEGGTVTRILLRTVHDVDQYVQQIRARGERQVFVAREGEEARPYDEWRAEQPDPLLAAGKAL